MKSVRLTLLCMAAAVLSACSTPFCDAPGGLCSPQPAKTSLPPPPVAVRPAAPLPPKAPPGPDLPPAEVFAVTMTGATVAPETGTGSGPAIRQADTGARFVNDSAPPSGAPVRIGLLLPLRSDTLGAAAESVRAGFMAGLERDRDNITVTVVETGDVPQDILGAYTRALQSEDIVVGPLSRTAVAAVAGSALVSKPTIALNYPEGYGQPGALVLPPQMLAIGLSIEEEARQAAQWAAADQPSGSALVLTTSSAWQRRVAAAFANQWEGRQGRPLRIVELSAPDGYLSDPELVQLRARLRQDTPAVLFSAMGADQTRQLRIALGSVLTTEPDNPIFSTADKLPPPPTVPTEQFASLPIYGTSALNPGAGAGFPGRDLEGVRLLDLPWQVQRDHPAVMVYPRPLQSGVGSADMARLYALGIDAFRVAREIARHPAGRFQLDGVTGKLSVDFGQGAAQFERIEQPAVYQNGVPQPAKP